MPGAGSTTRITCLSPTYGTLKFVAMSDSDTTYHFHGPTANKDSKVTGEGRRIQQIQLMGAGMDFAECEWDMDGREDVSTATLLSAESRGQTWTAYNEGSGVTHVLQGGYPVGQIDGSGFKGTFALSLEGVTLEKL